MALFSGLFDKIRRLNYGKGRVRAEGLSRICWGKQEDGGRRCARELQGGLVKSNNYPVLRFCFSPEI